MSSEQVAEITRERHGQRGGLIAALHEVQARFNYLPREALEDTARNLGLPLSQVCSVASFFTSFSFTPVGKHIVYVCVGTTCHVKGAGAIADYLERELGIPHEGVSEDGLFTLRKVRCLGCCSLAPVIKIDDLCYGRVTRAEVRRIIGEQRGAEGVS